MQSTPDHLSARRDHRRKVLELASHENHSIASSTNPTAPSTTSSSSLPVPSTANISGSPDQRRVQKLESGVLDLSVRDLQTKDLPGVTQLVSVCSVHSLLLAHNRLTSLTILMPISIIYLDLSHNAIAHLDSRGLDSLVNLRTLLASHNQLTTMVGLDQLLLLETLDLSHNDIVQAEPLPAHRALYELNLSYNVIDDVDNLRTMALSHMQVLHLRGNPLALPGSNYRNVVSHMMPSVRVLDGSMQAPSPYVHIDEVSDSPARRKEAHGRATGIEKGGDGGSRGGRIHWAKKPNVVTKNKKRGLSYSTIHARKVAAATERQSPTAGGNGGSGGSGGERIGTTEEGMNVMNVTSPTSNNDASNGRRSTGKKRTAIGSNENRKKIHGARKTPNKNQISRDPPSSIAMQMTKNHLERKNGRSISPPLVINLPSTRATRNATEGDENYSSEEEDSQTNRRNLGKKKEKTTKRSTPRLSIRQQRIAERTKQAQQLITSSSSASKIKKHTRNSSHTSNASSLSNGSRSSRTSRTSRTSSSKKNKRIRKRPSPVTTHGFGRTGSFNQHDSDASTLNANLTPRTLAFASNLRASGTSSTSKGRKPNKTETVSSMKKRAQERAEERIHLRKQTTSLNNQVSDLEIQESVQQQHVTMEDERVERIQNQQQEDAPMTYDELRGNGTVQATRRNNSTTDTDNTDNTNNTDKGDEWNSILHALIDQKKKSLALLYQSLANESESQMRMVNSNATLQEEENNNRSRIHIDRGGRVTSYQ